MGKMIGFVEGADVYLVIALILFMAVFVFAAVYMFSLSKEDTKKLSHLPFNNEKTNNHEG